MAIPNIREVGRRVAFSECKPGAVFYLNQADQFQPFEIEFTGLRGDAFGHPCLVLGQMFHEHVEICPVLAGHPAEGLVLQLRTSNVSKTFSSGDTDRNSPTPQEPGDQLCWNQFHIAVEPKPQNPNDGIDPLDWEGNALPDSSCGGYVDLSGWGIVPCKMLSMIMYYGGLDISRLDLESVKVVRDTFNLKPLTEEAYSCEDDIAIEGRINDLKWGGRP
ncbi:hypothetical protein MMC11_008651 [Xylographa trunciseda]|nr:hypothetical protein [Xylographa trunciseda]